MRAFYATHVHDHLYRDVDKSLAKYRVRILHELKMVGLSADAIKDKVIFDIGSGFQSIVFAELGAKQVYHVDLNEEHVAWVRQQYSSRRLSAISSECMDVMQDIGAVENFDLAFICGVFHHLSSPSTLLRKLRQRSHASSRIYARCYHSGTWSRWLVQHLREVSALLDPDCMKALYTEMFPILPDHQFLSDMLDDLFTPIWHCLSPDLFQRDARALAMDCYCPDEPFAGISFDNRDENFRVLMTNQSSVSGIIKDHSFYVDQPINQSTLQSPLLDRINFHSLWNNFTQLMAQCDETTAALRLLFLYTLCRSRQCYDAFRMVPQKQQPMPSNIVQYRLYSLATVLDRWLQAGTTRGVACSAGREPMV